MSSYTLATSGSARLRLNPESRSRTFVDGFTGQPIQSVGFGPAENFPKDTSMKLALLAPISLVGSGKITPHQLLDISRKGPPQLHSALLS